MCPKVCTLAIWFCASLWCYCAPWQCHPISVQPSFTLTTLIIFFMSFLYGIMNWIKVILTFSWQSAQIVKEKICKMEWMQAPELSYSFFHCSLELQTLQLCIPTLCCTKSQRFQNKREHNKKDFIEAFCGENGSLNILERKKSKRVFKKDDFNNWKCVSPLLFVFWQSWWSWQCHDHHDVMSHKMWIHQKIWGCVWFCSLEWFMEPTKQCLQLLMWRLVFSCLLFKQWLLHACSVADTHMQCTGWWVLLLNRGEMVISLNLSWESFKVLVCCSRLIEK